MFERMPLQWSRRGTVVEMTSGRCRSGKMTHIGEVVRIFSNPALCGPEKRAQIFGYLADQQDRGVSPAVQCLLETVDESIAEYVAQYLQLVPGVAQEKTRAAERLRATKSSSERLLAKLEALAARGTLEITPVEVPLTAVHVGQQAGGTRQLRTAPFTGADGHQITYLRRRLLPRRAWRT
jgi:hypothetical protein